MKGITAYGAYVPRYCLDKAEIGAVHGGRGKGARAVASFDEDTTTLAVQAARLAPPPDDKPRPLWLATSNPAYMDKSNATIARAALDLSEEEAAIDVSGALRSGNGALLAASDSGGLALMSDIQIGLPGSVQELQGGDGAAAFCFDEGENVVAELVTRVSTSREFLDRWRMPGELKVRQWEERFGGGQYLDVMRNVLRRLLEDAGNTPEHVVLSCPNAKVLKALAREFSAESAVITRLEEVGYAGAADAGLMLADVLDRARPGESIVVVSAADGCDGFAFRATEALPRSRSALSVAEQIAHRYNVPYTKYLTWRGLLERQPPRRPDPEAPSPSAAGRGTRWKYALVGSRCTSCGQVHLPPDRVCASCGEADAMTEYRAADRRAKVRTYTVDHLAFSLSPPVVVAVLDFDDGGRLISEVTDIEPEAIDVGLPVKMQFRRHYTSEGIHNYFWKASVVRSE